jgi:hypothetical protein
MLVEALMLRSGAGTVHGYSGFVAFLEMDKRNASEPRAVQCSSAT